MQVEYSRPCTSPYMSLSSGLPRVPYSHALGIECSCCRPLCPPQSQPRPAHLPDGNRQSPAHGTCSRGLHKSLVLLDCKLKAQHWCQQLQESGAPAVMAQQSDCASSDDLQAKCAAWHEIHQLLLPDQPVTLCALCPSGSWPPLMSLTSIAFGCRATPATSDGGSTCADQPSRGD